MKPAIPPEQRFWPLVQKTATCWLWQGHINDQGYGLIFLSSGKPIRAHRFAYEMLVGPIPEGMELDHVKTQGCQHRHCVNPAHLEPVTHAENMRRTMGELCQNGHVYDERNTYICNDGDRHCRKCAAAYQARRRGRRTPEQKAAELAYFRNRVPTPEQRQAKNALQRERRAAAKGNAINGLLYDTWDAA